MKFEPVVTLSHACSLLSLAIVGMRSFRRLVLRATRSSALAFPAISSRICFCTAPIPRTDLWGSWVHQETKKRRDDHESACARASRLTFSQAACGYGFALFYTKKLSTPLLLWASSGKEDTIVVPFHLPSETVHSVDCGRSHVVVLSSHGHVYTAGYNAFGQCGYNNDSNKEMTFKSAADYVTQNGFRRIDTVREKIVQVACGLDHTLFLAEKGTVYSCGWGADGQTGLGHYGDEMIPHQVHGCLDGRLVKQISASTDCSLALTTDGTVFGWGNTEYQQLGANTTKTQVAAPKVIPSDLFKGRVVQVAAGGSFSLFLTSDGAVYSLGYGAGLGLGKNVEATSVPKQVVFSSIQDDDEVGLIGASVDYSVAVTRNGNLFVWGHNRHKQLGLCFEQCADLWKPAHVKLPFRVDRVDLGVDCMSVIGWSV